MSTELRGAFLDDVVDSQHRHVKADAGVQLWLVRVNEGFWVQGSRL